MREYVAEAVEVLGMAVIAYGLFSVAAWAGIIAAGVFLLIIGLAIGANK
jgi:hypothetical protein